MIRNSSFLIVMIVMSLISIMVLVGAYLYGGSVIPSTEYDSVTYSAVVWVMWVSFVLIPIITAVLLFHRWSRRRGEKRHVPMQ